jgi:hypothetical protein
MALGYPQAPVVYAGPDNHSSGFRCAEAMR